MYVYTYVYVYIYVYIYIYIHWYRYTPSQTDLCMSISIYGRAQHTCGHACPHAQTQSYTRIHTHTNWNAHTFTLTYQGILLFFQCQFDTLFESRVFNRKLIVGILWIFCWFVCYYETRKSILSLPPWDRSKVRRNPCLPQLNRLLVPIHTIVTLDRHRSTNWCVPLVETRFGHYCELWNRIKEGPSRCLRAS